MSANATLIAAVVGVGVALKGAYQEWQKYAGEVRDVMEISGMAAEESSKLIQLLDDFEISTSTLQTAVRAMTNQGLVPTVDTIAQLSDEFKSLETQQEKNEFLFKNFGRSGIEWVNILSRGSDEIHKLNDEALKSLILTDKQIADAEKQRLAMDALADSWQGVKVQVGSFVGAQILAIDESQKMIEKTREYAKENGIVIRTQQQAREITEMLTERERALNAETEHGAAVAEYYRRQLVAVNGVIEGEVIPTIEELTKVNQDYLATVGSMTTELQDFTKSEQELTEEHANLLAEKQKLIAQGWWVESDAVKDVTAQLAENEAKQAANADAFELASNRRILARLEEELSIDGLDEREKDYILESGLRMGVYTQEAVEMIKNEDRELQILVNRFGDIPAHTQAVIDILANVTAQYQGGTATQQTQQGGYAGGTKGWLTVPSGYPDDSYPVMLQSGEQFAVIPSGAQKASGYAGGSGMGGVVINILLDSATPDPEKVAYNLAPAVTRVLRQLGVPV